MVCDAADCIIGKGGGWGGGLQLGGWMVGEGICGFYPVFRLHFRPSVIRLQMRVDA
jgi:hypothetical protein